MSIIYSIINKFSFINEYKFSLSNILVSRRILIKYFSAEFTYLLNNSGYIIFDELIFQWIDNNVIYNDAATIRTISFSYPINFKNSCYISLITYTTTWATTFLTEITKNIEYIKVNFYSGIADFNILIIGT